MSSPMQWISPVTPPPSFTSVRTPAKCKNPFDANLTEHLHLETFSPSVFSQVLSPSDDNDSNWRIEHVALLNPTDFSPNFHSHMADPATEAEAQEKILQFFSQKQIAPSPWSQPRIRCRSKSKTPAESSKPAASSKNGTIYLLFFFTHRLKFFFLFPQHGLKLVYHFLQNCLMKLKRFYVNIAPMNHRKIQATLQ